MKNRISIVIPVYNEEDNIKYLIDELQSFIQNNPKYIFEVIMINDGSSDNTENEVNKHKKDWLRIISFARNFGQTAALSAGFEAATGDIVVAMDGDLQNDTQEITKLLEKIEEGYDVVSGWRKNRKDRFLRVFMSNLANEIISVVSGVRLHDFGCTLKAYKREFLKDIKLYGEMHRFIPIYSYWHGAKIAEVVVNHKPRVHGKSKYGMIRIFKVLLDLITIKYLGSYSTKPIYFFGGSGIILILSSLALFAVTIYQKIFLSVWVHRNPVFLLSIFLFIVGVQFLFFGLIAEIMIRTYYESTDTKTYRIRNDTDKNNQ